MANNEFPQNQNNMLMRYNNSIRHPEKEINKIAYNDKFEEE